MADKIAKAYEMTDAKITFISLVDKAANKKQFLITKAAGGSAQFQTYGRILKADAKAHYVTGIVYEPMAEDTQGNYMTEEEITKAAHWFAKNGNRVDLQHSFEPLEGASVVESSVAKCDYELEGETIKKGTWIMTVELTSPEVFEAIEKGEITGFSMGGMGRYSQEDTDISKAAEITEAMGSSGKGILKRLAGLFGMDVVEKGRVRDAYMDRIISENFWQAFYALQDVLFRWNYYEDKRVAESEPEAVREALADFNEIVTELLSDTKTVMKSVEGICKAGRKMSSDNKNALKAIHESLGEFLSKFEDGQEETEVTKAEVEEIVKSAVAEYRNGNYAAVRENENSGSITKSGVVKMVKEAVSDAVGVQSASQGDRGTKAVTKAEVQDMIDAAIRKAAGEGGDEAQEPDMDSLAETITKAVSGAMEPFMKQAGLPTNLNNSIMQKSEDQAHYLHGFL